MSNEKYNTLAFDFGASSGRAIVGSFDGEKIELSEIHRYPMTRCLSAELCIGTC